MAFGKNKKEKELNEELQKVNKEIADLKQGITPEQGINQIPFQSALSQNQREETKPLTQQIPQQVVQPTTQLIPQQLQQPINKAKIIGCEILENNLFKFTFISNASMGNVGQEFDI